MQSPRWLRPLHRASSTLVALTLLASVIPSLSLFVAAGGDGQAKWGVQLKSPGSAPPSKAANWDSSAADAAQKYRNLKGKLSSAPAPDPQASSASPPPAVRDPRTKLGYNVKAICDSGKCVTHGKEWGCTKQSPTVFKLRPWAYQLYGLKEGAQQQSMKYKDAAGDLQEFVYYDKEDLNKLDGYDRKKERAARKEAKQSGLSSKQTDPAVESAIAEQCPNQGPHAHSAWCHRMVRLNQKGFQATYLYPQTKKGLVVSCSGKPITVVVIPANVKDVPADEIQAGYKYTGDLNDYGKVGAQPTTK